jgi:hypothetical protein
MTIHSHSYKTSNIIHVSVFYGLEFLIMQNRSRDRVRHSNPHLEFLPTEKLGRLKRGLSLEVSSTINDETINRFRNNHLLEGINKFQ